MATIEIARHKEFRLTGYDNVENSVKLAEQLDHAAKKANTSKVEFVHNALLNACQAGTGLSTDALKFDSDPLEDYDGLSEQELVAAALKDTTLLAMAKKCLVTEAKRQYQSNQTTKRDGTERKRATTDNVQDRIHALVVERMKTNDSAANWYEKRAINSTWLQKGGKEDKYGRTTGLPNVFGFQSVKQYLDVHSAEIEAHHAKHAIKGNFNQKVSNELKRMAKAG